MRTRRFISLAVVLGAFLFIPAAFWADDGMKKSDEKEEKQAPAPKKQLTEKEKADAEVWQKSRLPLLVHTYKSYEGSLVQAHKPSARANRKLLLSNIEKNFRELFDEIINYDPDSKYADEARIWLKRFETIKKNGPTT